MQSRRRRCEQLGQEWDIGAAGGHWLSPLLSPLYGSLCCRGVWGRECWGAQHGAESSICPNALSLQLCSFSLCRHLPGQEGAETWECPNWEAPAGVADIIGVLQPSCHMH